MTVFLKIFAGALVTVAPGGLVVLALVAAVRVARKKLQERPQ